jgi:polyhydroxyalkanoate synthesis regulator phasin
MSTNRPAAAAKPASARTQAMRQGRQADTDRRRQRVLIAINQATETGAETSVSAVARAAGVDRTFIYRHHDLLENLHAQIRTPTFTDAAVLSVTRASLQADLLAAHERAHRLNARIQHLERRLSEALGDKVWRDSGLATPVDVDALHQQIARMEQQVIDLRITMEERDEDLAAARATNRELMTQLNRLG